MNNSKAIYHTKNLNKCIRNSIILKTYNKYKVNNLNEFSKTFIYPLIFIYKTIDFTIFRETFYYIYYYFKNGIVVHINNNKLKSFTPFNNEYYYNPFLKYLYFNEKDKKQLEKLDKLRKNRDIKNFYKLEKKNKEFVKLYTKTYKYNREVMNERRKWIPDGYYFINLENDDIQKNYIFIYKYFLKEYIKYSNNENLLFFLNLRNFPISKKDNTYPLDNIIQNHKIPYQTNFPILSLYTSDKYNDIPIPLPWDIRYIFDDILFPDISCEFINKKKLEFQWKNKTNKLCFRGYLIGNGNDAKTNMRIKAYEIGLTNPEIFDIGILDFKKQLKKNFNQSLIIFQTKYFSNTLNDYEQSFYKYILILEGHFASSSISFRLHMKSCILLQESENKVWFSDLLIPFKHYVPIRNDLSDLVEKTNWCMKNDKKCEKIALNGYKIIKKILTKKYIFDYMNKILNKNCKLKINRFIKIKNKVCIIIIYQKNKKYSTCLQSILKYYETVHPNIDIYVIEQSQKDNINYGMMKNVGFDLTKNKNYDYFIFSNIYYVPDDELSQYLYNCNKFPFSFGLRGSRYQYMDPSEYMSYYEKNKEINLEQNISNMVCFDKETFIKLNGYPNQFWGISGENLILLSRMYKKKLKLYYPKKGRLINIIEKNKNIQDFKKIKEYMQNKSLEKDGLYDIRKYYNILYNKENYFKVDILKIKYQYKNIVNNENIINNIKKIKCEYI